MEWKKKSDTRAPYQTASTEADSSSSSLLVVDWRRGQLSSGVYLSPVPVEDDISQKGDSVAGRAGSLLQMDSARTVLPPPSSWWWWPPRLGLPGDVISAGFRKGVGGVRKDWWRWQVAGCRLSPPRASRNTGFWCYPICTNLWSESSTRFRAPISFSSSTAHLHLLFWLSLHNNTVQSTVYEP